MILESLSALPILALFKQKIGRLMVSVLLKKYTLINSMYREVSEVSVVSEVTPGSTGFRGSTSRLIDEVTSSEVADSNVTV